MAIKKRAKKVRAVPKGYEGVTPYLILENAVAALTFYKKAFGAKSRGKPFMAGDKVGHAELTVGDGLVMVADTFPGYDRQRGQLLFYVPDVDKAYKKAVTAGAKSLDAPTDKFYGDRMCRLEDPFGVIWCLATHIEDVSPAEMKKRMKAMKF